VTEDIELREILRATAERATLPSGMPEPMRRKVTRRRARTVGATFLVTAAIVVGGAQGIRTISLDDAAPPPPADRPDGEGAKVTVMVDDVIRDVTPDAAPPKVPYLLDLNTRDMTPLSEAITGGLTTNKFDSANRFAASPDGSSLAFVGEGADGSPQIFIAGIEGTGVRQVTRDPKGATSPAWSPDGTRIAYVGYGIGEVPSLFVVEVATEESTRITSDTTHGLFEPQFTPDGSSLIYTDASALTINPDARDFCCGSNAVVRSVPVDGGESTPLGPRGSLSEGLEGVDYWAEASMSPDGSLVTFVGSGNPPETVPEGAIEHCDRCRFLVDADGTDKRIITGWTATPSGAWSPDSTRIVVARDSEPPFPIIVVGVMTGEASMVADRPASAAIWVDDHTLLIDV
jgi:WD40-like Beta Propeller Repeat